MLDNKRYFDYSKKHPEGLFDPYYAKDKVVIPLRAEKKNKLTANNEKLIDLITAFEVAVSMGKDKNNENIREISKLFATITRINATRKPPLLNLRTYLNHILHVIFKMKIKSLLMTTIISCQTKLVRNALNDCLRSLI